MSLTVLGESWYRHVSLQGRIVEFKADTDFADIDRLSRHYGGNPYPDARAPAHERLDRGRPLARVACVSYSPKSR